MRAPRTSSQPILPLEDLTSASSLTSLLSLLFEPSPPLRSLLVPSVLLRLTALDSPPDSYNQPIDICADVAGGWTWDQKADFLSGHPLIGEIKGLSEMSGEEQGGATPEVVLDRWVQSFPLGKKTGLMEQVGPPQRAVLYGLPGITLRDLRERSIASRYRARDGGCSRTPSITTAPPRGVSDERAGCRV